MALNTVQSQNGMPILDGSESILLSYNNVQLAFSDMNTTPGAFKGKKKGKVFLTQQRVIFIPRDQSKPLKSFSMPFHFMEGCSVEQGIFTANYIKGKIHAQPQGGWEGTATFKLTFYSGGAIDFGKGMIHVASQAFRGRSTYGPMIYVYETVRILPSNNRSYRSPAVTIQQNSQTAPFTYVPGPPPPAGGYYVPAPSMYGQYAPPPPSYFGSMQPPPNYPVAGRPGMPPTNAYFAPPPHSGFTQPPHMTPTAGMPAGYNPSAPPALDSFSSPLTSPEQPIPSVSAAGTSSDFNPSISSMHNYYASPLNASPELPLQSIPAAKKTVPLLLLLSDTLLLCDILKDNNGILHPI
ncbi:WW domain-binding protein 2-like [Heptranchias perlo]|uniref:WW domain-binding protein 2-like n=1 Tax=Heptranchias perlo TaxID=212740 RepID=UPI003559A42A